MEYIEGEDMARLIVLGGGVAGHTAATFAADLLGGRVRGRAPRG